MHFNFENKQSSFDFTPRLFRSVLPKRASRRGCSNVLRTTHMRVGGSEANFTETVKKRYSSTNKLTPQPRLKAFSLVESRGCLDVLRTTHMRVGGSEANFTETDEDFLLDGNMLLSWLAGLDDKDSDGGCCLVSTNRRSNGLLCLKFNKQGIFMIADISDCCREFCMMNYQKSIDLDSPSSYWKESGKFLNMAGGLRPVGKEVEWENEKAEFNRFLAPLRRVFDVEGDGNCLFHALSHRAQEIGIPQGDHRNLRRLAVEQLERDKDFYQQHIDGNFNLYVDRIRREGEWGDHLEIQAISDALNWKIIVLSKEQEKIETLEIQPRSRSEDEQIQATIVILYSREFQHYMSTEDRYRDHEILAKGGSGNVFKAFDKFNNTQIAIKEIYKQALLQNNNLLACLENEISFLQSVNNPNIVKLDSTFEVDSSIVNHYEYCNQGTLELKLQNTGELPESISLKYFDQLLNAFRSLRANKVIHRDIKPENILLHNDVIKLADFGFCCKYEQKELMSGFWGTPLYAAPEIVFGTGCDDKCDIWSLGIVLFRMLFNSFPVWGEDEHNFRENLMNFDSVHSVLKDKGKLSHGTKSLLEKMLIKDPKKRIGWDELFEYKNTMGYEDANVNSVKYYFTPVKGKFSKKNEGFDTIGEDVKLRLEEEERKRRNLSETKKVKDDKANKTGGKLKQPKIQEVFSKNNMSIENEGAPYTNKKVNKGDPMSLEDDTKSDSELLNMIKVLWNERENQKEKFQIFQEDAEKTRGEIANLQTQLIQLEEESFKLRREKTEHDSHIRDMERNFSKLEQKIISLENLLKKASEKKQVSQLNVDSAMSIEETKPKKFIQENLVSKEGKCEHEFCQKLSARIDQIEELVKTSLKDQNNKATSRNNTRLIEIENNIRALNLRVDQFSYSANTHLEEIENVKSIEKRVANIEGWRKETVRALNNVVIEAVARLQRQVRGITKRIDEQSKFIGYNKYVYDEDGFQLNIRTESIQANFENKESNPKIDQVSKRDSPVIHAKVSKGKGRLRGTGTQCFYPQGVQRDSQYVETFPFDSFRSHVPTRTRDNTGWCYHQGRTIH